MAVASVRPQVFLGHVLVQRDVSDNRKVREKGGGFKEGG